MLSTITLLYMTHALMAPYPPVTGIEQGNISRLNTSIAPVQIVIARPTIFGGFSENSNAAVMLWTTLQDHLQNLMPIASGFAVLEEGLNTMSGMTIEDIADAGTSMGADLVILVELYASADASASLSIIDTRTSIPINSDSQALNEMLLPATGLYDALSEELALRIHALLVNPL